MLSFLPLSFFNQFKQYANIYFLMIAILQLFPQIATQNPVSSITPLLFVVSLSMIREALEDISKA